MQKSTFKVRPLSRRSASVLLCLAGICASSEAGHGEDASFRNEVAYTDIACCVDSLTYLDEKFDRNLRQPHLVAGTNDFVSFAGDSVEVSDDGRMLRRDIAGDLALLEFNDMALVTGKCSAFASTLAYQKDPGRFRIPTLERYPNCPSFIIRGKTVTYLVLLSIRTIMVYCIESGEMVLTWVRAVAFDLFLGQLRDNPLEVFRLEFVKLKSDCQSSRSKKIASEVAGIARDETYLSLNFHLMSNDDLLVFMNSGNMLCVYKVNRTGGRTLATRKILYDKVSTYSLRFSDEVTSRLEGFVGHVKARNQQRNMQNNDLWLLTDKDMVIVLYKYGPVYNVYQLMRIDEPLGTGLRWGLQYMYRFSEAG